MPYKDLDYQKKYREKNKEKKKAFMKEYYEKNKEKKREYQKEYREKNKETIKQQQKEYKQTEEGKKTNRITKWKHIGLIHDNYDQLYEYYLNTTHCEKCNIELTYDKQNTSTTKCMDHSHRTGQFRNILCFNCNIKRKEDNF